MMGKVARYTVDTKFIIKVPEFIGFDTFDT